jgi:hypothetical protein
MATISTSPKYAPRDGGYRKWPTLTRKQRDILVACSSMLRINHEILRVNTEEVRERTYYQARDGTGCRVFILGVKPGENSLHASRIICVDDQARQDRLSATYVYYQKSGDIRSPVRRPHSVGMDDVLVFYSQGSG